MNMKDTVILLLFLLSVLGLIVGVYYTEVNDSEYYHKGSWEKVYDDDGSVLTITLEKKEKEKENDLSRFFT